MSAFPNIISERVLVREWRADELEGMHRWLADPLVNEFLSFGTTTQEESQRHLDEVIASQSVQPRKHYYLAIELIESGLTIGDTGFTWNEQQVAEIGYFIEPFYWGKGLASEAARVMIQYAFDQGAHTVLASCDKKNHNSEKVMQRCGMRRRASADHGRLVYGISEEEWNLQTAQ